jgi:hypothetical protein
MQQRLRFAIITIFVAALSAVMIAVGSSDQESSWDDPVQQWKAIKFSHKKHVEELGAECSSCHAGAQTSENANDLMLPKHDECGACHSAEVEETCGFCHVDADNPVAYAAPKREVRFSHKLHIEKSKLECAACHAGVEKSETPTIATLPVMAACNTCHDNVKAKNACESCHTRPETLLPMSHRGAGWAKEHKRLVRVGGMSNDCAVCHSDNFCQACHAGVTTQFTKGNLIRSIPENRASPDGGQLLVKQRVHDLNFVFTHAIDLRSKTSDCVTCHDQQTFCTDCHVRNQDSGFPSPVPQSHRAADFIRIGKGSGGGQHAGLARRDMESCASCHDVEGRDPVCVTCHQALAPKGKSK